MKRLFTHIGMTVFTLGLALIPLSPQNFFGSEGDWISQHVGAAENIRQMILSTGTLFPQYSAAGGGCNIYDYAYYGLYRPDVLCSCLFPDIEMKYFIAGYALLCMVMSVNLCYLWLRERKVCEGCALFSALLLSCASCFFHAHHQIMFVNYLPFLILALMGIDRLLEKRKSGLMIFGLTMICFHSFYYAPCCYIVCLLYGIDQIKGDEWRKNRYIVVDAVRNVLLSMGIAAVLLLPTAMNILSTEKDAGAFMNEGLQLVDLTFKGLLFTPYGCGMTFISLCCLVIALTRKSRRFMAASILIAMTIPAVSWILNGFLYARGKILIPFLPLIIWICGDTVAYLQERLVEKGVSLEWIHRGIPVLLIIPMLTSLSVNQSEDYIAADDQRQSRFTLQEIDEFTIDKRYRFDWLSNPFVNSNLVGGGGTYKTAMYSSIYNSGYGTFYYDTMKNPISLRNRVVLMPSQNPFFHYFMGIRYIQCHRSHIPEGYTAIREKDGYVLAENENVLPIAYGTSKTLDMDVYEQLDFPEDLEALCRYTVVQDGLNQDRLNQNFDSKIEAADFDAILTGTIEPGSQTLSLKKPLKHKILMIQFTVDDPKKKGVEITIDGVQNCLSSASAPYPNHNQTFTYIFAVKDGTKELAVEASQGEWTISDLQVYLMDMSHLGLDEFYMAEESATKDGNTMFAGKIEMKQDGHFVTSFPYRKGYRILVNGQSRDIERVNTAFVGFSLDQGVHQIEINYEAPGFEPGLTLTCISIVVSLLLLIWERKRER